ncbi:MAG: carboxypeptidase-like regulatory domain-containing protein, partial [Longimicrobiaceae bacterium]
MRRCARLLAFTAGLTVLPATAAAQEGTVAGTVVDEQSLRPLAGAQVAVEGTGRGTLANSRGEFLLTGLTGAEVSLRVTLIGYRTVDRSVEVGATDLRIALSETAIELDEVVVTGTAGAVERRSIGNAVSTIDAAA